MAQTLEEIREDIEAAQAEFPELAELNSPSATSFWRLLKNMFALLTLNLQQAMDNYRAEVDAIVDAPTRRIGTLAWYADQLKKFQFGDDLSVSEKGIFYAVDKPDAKIIAQAAVEEEEGEFIGERSKLILKVAKRNANNMLVKLNSEEMLALGEYVDNIKIAGTFTVLRSEDADIIRLNVLIEPNPLMIDRYRGNRLTDENSFPIREAIEKFLQELPFNGRLYLSALSAHLLEMEEVNDVRLGFYVPTNTSLEWTKDHFYDSYSGHIAFTNQIVIHYILLD